MSGLTVLYFRSITFGELQRALGEDEDSVIGWKLIDRLTLVTDADQSPERSISPIYEELFDENHNELALKSNNNGANSEENTENKERKLRRVSSGVGSNKERRRSSTAKFS